MQMEVGAGRRAVAMCSRWRGRCRLIKAAVKQAAGAGRHMAADAGAPRKHAAGCQGLAAAGAALHIGHAADGSAAT
jgi:hypothetical protein